MTDIDELRIDRQDGYAYTLEAFIDPWNLRVYHPTSFHLSFTVSLSRVTVRVFLKTLTHKPWKPKSLAKSSYLSKLMYLTSLFSWVYDVLYILINVNHPFVLLLKPPKK